MSPQRRVYRIEHQGMRSLPGFLFPASNRKVLMPVSACHSFTADSVVSAKGPLFLLIKVQGFRLPFPCAHMDTESIQS